MINIATKKDLKYSAAAAREIPTSKFVPYTRTIDDYTLATKEGYLLQIIKLQGLPFETADQLDLNHAKNIRANMLKAISNSRFGIYQHVIRRQIQDTNPGFFENNWCQDLEHAYQNRLATKKMFINEHYLTIIRRPATSKVGMISEILKTISGKIDQNVHADLQKEAHQALFEAVSNILNTLSPYTPQLLKLTDTKDGLYSEQLSFLSYLINGEMREIRLPCMSLADYLPTKRFSFGRESFEIRGSAPDDIKLGGILSVKEYTNATGPGMLDGLLRLPHEFIITQSFGFVDRQTSLSSINDATRKMIASDAGAHSLIEDMEHAKDELSSGQTSFGEHHLTITALGKNTDELARALSECHGELVNMGMMAVREDINLEAAFWAQLPGNFSYIARRSLISTHNFASLASLHNFPAGRKDGNHWGSAITQFETTSGTPYWFNFHERDVGNFTLIGPTGTGKTVLLTFLMAQARRLSPTCIYFDKDRGAEIFIRAINGTYTVVRAGRPTGLNPLQLPDTPENRSFLKDWLTILIESDGGTPLTPHEHEILNDAITANYETSPKNRRLSHLCELLSGYGGSSEYTLITRMADWHGEGSRAWLFDNEQDSLALENPVLGFDLTSILDDPLSRTPWLLYIFHRITTLLDGRKTIIMLDEGWKMLDDPAFNARIKDWMKTIRKQNGIVGFATQSAKDACSSAIGDAIIEQSPTQIFLPNARAQEKDYCGGFGLSAHELEIIRKLTPQSRCFLIRHGTESVIAKLDLSGMDQFINVLSGRTESIRHMEDLIITHGQAPENWLSHFQDERNAA
jgi:type IV secretion system protein VirB4